MVRFFLRRLILLPLALLLANLFGFSFAHYIAPVVSSRNPYSFGAIELPPVIPVYWDYLKAVFAGDFGTMPNGEAIASLVSRTGINSLGLLLIVLFLSSVAGILLGVRAVRLESARISSWLTVLSTMGLASPSFYIGILFIAVSVIILLWGPWNQPLLPFQGFGWDAHLILPTLALMVQPTVKVAQVTAGLLTEELGKQYIVAARSFGHSLKAIRSHAAFRNIAASVILAIAASLRLLVAEMIIIERLFNWPGFGKLISTTLVIHTGSDNFLFPPLVAAMMTILIGLFLLTDFIASLLARSLDPRLRAAEKGTS